MFERKNAASASAEKLPLVDTIEVTVSREDIDYVLNNPSHTADDVMRLFSKDFGHLFAQSAGTLQGYTLGQHTRMVLKQYHKYFKQTVFPAGVDNVFFETVLVLHDIGKPEANSAGEIDNQYAYHQVYFNQILPQLGFGASQLALANCLINSDPIREYLYKNRTGPESAAVSITSKAAEAGMSVKEFWFLLKLMWLCDAGSYTVDAGGHAELDRMFEFEPDEGEMNLAPHIQKYFDALEQKLGV
jgi:hypothetical protein